MAEAAVGKRPMMEVITVGPLEVNCYLLWDAVTLDAFIIDPGGDADRILQKVAEKGLNVKYIINTHGHFDHVGANAPLTKALGAPVAIHMEDEGLLKEAPEQGILYGVRIEEAGKAQTHLKQGLELKAGRVTLKVIHTPGHTKGGVSLFSEDDGIVFTGDTLFRGGIGRTDFEGGSMDEIMDSIKNKLLRLPDPVRVFPGHGPSSTIGREKAENPFVLS
jgi:glyoxylase-like metal-dependent hydrolase (beta-lactamase superfamily II)